ncbi:MAG TPA: hypothetical protein PKW45_07390 [Bryobacteraceae bacterium]|nr:hypothetical protein [Bryobacteraceae bacterium]
MMSSKRIVLVGVLLLLAFGLSRAARFRFHATEEAFRKSCREQFEKLGMTLEAAKAKYFTPEIALVTPACLRPGGTGEVVIKGKFPPGTKFIFENDNIEVVKENFTGGEYRATLKAAPGIGPETAVVKVISPVTCITTQADRAAVVGGKFEWTMDAANGWRIVARSTGSGTCSSGVAGDEYEMLFFRKGESTPFETRNASLHFTAYSSTNYRFSIGGGGAGDIMSAQQDAAQLAQKLGDPSLSSAQQGPTPAAIAGGNGGGPRQLNRSQQHAKDAGTAKQVRLPYHQPGVAG